MQARTQKKRREKVIEFTSKEAETVTDAGEGAAAAVFKKKKTSHQRNVRQKRGSDSE